MKPYEIRTVSRQNQICIPKAQLDALGARTQACFKIRVVKSRKQIVLEYLGG